MRLDTAAPSACRRYSVALLATFLLVLIVHYLLSDDTPPPLKGQQRSSTNLRYMMTYKEANVAASPGAAKDIRILFVGNSFTYFNSGLDKVIPDILQELGYNVHARRYTKGGYFWYQHLADVGNSSTALYTLLGAGDTSRWDYVVFQEQSRALALGGRATADSLAALEGLVTLALGRGATPVLMLTWGYHYGDSKYPNLFPTYSAMQEHLTCGYAEAAAKMRAAASPGLFVAPVGLAWQAVHEGRFASATAGGGGMQDASATFAQLYSEDNIHPSPAGTFLEACVVAAALTGRKNEETQHVLQGVDPKLADYLQRVADGVVFGPPNPNLPPFPWAAAEHA